MAAQFSIPCTVHTQPLLTDQGCALQVIGSVLPANETQRLHQQQFPDSRPLPVLPLTGDRPGWHDGPWAFPWASHPTDQEPATHATVGTRSNTNPQLRPRHPSNLLHELTHNVRLRVATIGTVHTGHSPKPHHCKPCPQCHRPTRSGSYDAIDSAD